MFVDMQHHSPFFWAKLFFVAFVLLLWGVTLLPITYYALHWLVTTDLDWSYLVVVIPTFIIGGGAAWITYGIVLTRFNEWLKDNGLKPLWKAE
jgi:hypothetical protein